MRRVIARGDGISIFSSKVGLLMVKEVSEDRYPHMGACLFIPYFPTKGSPSSQSTPSLTCFCCLICHKHLFWLSSLGGWPAILTSNVVHWDLSRMFSLILCPLNDIKDMYYPSFAEWVACKIKIRLLAAHASIKCYVYQFLRN
uniref:Uncharacterized protein LOC105050097 n=1 Tax=Elaeis guineensis var. tenera TaxID=51953 RepID=A0A8N4EZI6_ELAGV|nr:uncharacterized protein LOC105050097 [Elaeis guineensis]